MKKITTLFTMRSDYRGQQDCLEYVSYRSAGMSINETATEMGISAATLKNWAGKFEEFGEAFAYGEQVCMAHWEKLGRENLENKEFNANLWYSQMKNKFGWTDKAEGQQVSAISIVDQVKRAQLERKQREKEVKAITHEVSERAQ